MWTMLVVVCFVAPAVVALASAIGAGASPAGCAVAGTIGIVSGALGSWVMAKFGRIAEAFARTCQPVWREWYMRGLYISVGPWTMLVTFVADWATSAVLRVVR